MWQFAEQTANRNAFKIHAKELQRERWCLN